MEPPALVPARDAEAELRRRYQRYLEAQAAALPGLLPRESVREVYRSARAAAGASGVEDPLALLTAFCARLLPLPPFSVWVEDYRKNPDAYREALGEAARAPARGSPTTVELRTLAHGGRRWYAGLDVFLDGDAWRGVIAFHAEEGGRTHRTGEVFRGAGPEELRERFLSFDDGTLAAFLRSLLP